MCLHTSQVKARVLCCPQTSQQIQSFPESHAFIFLTLHGHNVFLFLDPDSEGGSQNAILVVLVVVVVISSLKIPEAFLICSTARRNFAYTFVFIFPTDLLSQILKLFPN